MSEIETSAETSIEPIPSNEVSSNNAVDEVADINNKIQKAHES